MNETLINYKAIVEEGLKSLEFPEYPEGLYDSLDYFIHLGGKRIRPILTLMSAEMFDKITPKIIQAALGVELFHNFSLLHDDIMDNSSLRRNAPTVHRKWNINTAIISGDVLFIESFQKITDCQSTALNNIFLKTAKEVCEGQQYDMLYENSNNVTIEQYLEMIRLKTSVLLGCALQAGAILSETNSLNQQLIYDFGVNIGMAFQLQDDYLDSFGNTIETGKKVGGDILNNKKTFLYLKANELASTTQRQILSELKEEKDNEQKINHTLSIYRQLNVDQLSIQKMNYYFEKGLHCLNEIEINKERKEPLKELVQFLYERNY